MDVAALGLVLQVQRFQQWQAEQKARKKQAQHQHDVQDALMAQCAVDEADKRIKSYSNMLLTEAADRGLPAKPLALHATRAAKHRSALDPSM